MMVNGFEIWKSDSQRCATYRITTDGGAMCGRCMKTCPWNLEGLFAERPFRWAAMNIPKLAPALAKLDDVAGNGGLNPVKKWWWDLEICEDGGYRPARHPVNARDLQKDLDLKYEDQTLAVYPAPLTPPPWPYPAPMDREAGIQAYTDMLTPEQYKEHIAKGDIESVAHKVPGHADSPVLRMVVSKAEKLSQDVTLYEFRDPEGGDLPEWDAGAHLDIVVAPEFLRQYSMSGDPSDRTKYQIAVLREDEGRGGNLRVGLRQLGLHLETVHLRHDDVGHDQVGPHLVNQLQPGPPVAGADNVMAVIAQLVDQQLTQFLLIFHHDYLSHAVASDWVPSQPRTIRRDK
jgi:hypothetical protein